MQDYEPTSVRVPMKDGWTFACGGGLMNRLTNYMHVHCVIKCDGPVMLKKRKEEPTQKEIEDYCPKFKKL